MFCKDCGKKIDNNDKFCKYCGSNQTVKVNKEINDSFVNTDDGNQTGNIYNKGSIGDINQYIGVAKAKWYDNNKVSKTKLISIKTIKISAVIATITTLTTLYLNIRKIYTDGFISTTQPNKSSSILLNCTLVLMFITLFFILLATELSRRGIIRIHWNFIDITLVNISNRVYGIKIKEECPECITKPKGKLKLSEDNDGKYYVVCSKNPNHRFGLDHTKF